MPDLLLELFSEEIPARMQAQAAEDLRKGVTEALAARGLAFAGALAHVTPRRLTLHVVGLPARQPDQREERKGPRVGAPEAALAGFLKSAGLADISEASIESDPKKGDFYVARLNRPGEATVKILAEVIPAVIRGFPWPKSMRWGAASAAKDSLRWVRPLQSILCTFGVDGEEPETIAFDVGGLASGNLTHGHRFMAPGAIKVRRFEDYAAALEKAKVVLDAARRRDIILHDAKNLAFAAGLELVADDGLLAEVAGLVEWPVVLMGEFDESFLAIPPEVIRATIRANQKCFVLRGPDGKLANKFILVSNLAASDGGAAIAAGNARVVRARLSDAKFFWEGDLKLRLEDRLAKLDDIVFQEKLGTQGERVRRIMALARQIAPLVGADPEKAERAAMLCKADLVSDMVGEFPELQGLMGRYYASAQGESAEVAAAAEDHYRPQGPGDRVPSEPVSVAVALADKIDVLVGFWAIDEKPTGSKDPYALRRAALGVVRLILENAIRLPIMKWSRESVSLHLLSKKRSTLASAIYTAMNPSSRAADDGPRSVLIQLEPETEDASAELALAADLLAFFADRLKVHLREKGARHDLIDAVFALPGQDDLLMIARRVEALGAFLDGEDGQNLLAGYKRANNILRAEERKDGAGAFDGAHAPSLRQTHEENILASAVARANAACAECLKAEDFEGAIRALGRLRAPVDAFFDKVTVNDSDPRVRKNRLQLLNELRQTMNLAAEFSKVAG